MEAISSENNAMVAAQRKAAPLVREFHEKLKLGDKELMDATLRAYHLSMSEGVRRGIIATCQELDLWPPSSSPQGIPPEDCAYEDTAEPLVVIAQRIYNDEMRREKDDGMRQLSRRANTASFIVDFAIEQGVKMPPLSESHTQMLEEFMARVAEWTQGRQDQPGPSSISTRARRAFLAGLGPGSAAEQLRQQIKAQWSKNWETTAGTLINISMVALAAAAGAATLHRMARRK
jgi:hypothetical protein